MTDDPLLLVKALLFLGIVLIAIYLLVWILKKLNTVTSSVAKQGEGPRLQIREAIQVDHKRRLVLVRRDHVEHLVLIGGENDLLVEHHIMPQQPLHPAAGQPRHAPPRPVQQRPNMSQQPASQQPAAQRPQSAPAVQVSPQATPEKADAEPAKKMKEDRDTGPSLGKRASSLASAAASSLSSFGRSDNKDTKNKDQEAGTTGSIPADAQSLPPHPLKPKDTAADEKAPEDGNKETSVTQDAQLNADSVSIEKQASPQASDRMQETDSPETEVDVTKAPENQGIENQGIEDKPSETPTTAAEKPATAYDDEINRLLNELSGDSKK